MSKKGEQKTINISAYKIDADGNLTQIEKSYTRKEVLQLTKYKSATLSRHEKILWKYCPEYEHEKRKMYSLSDIWILIYIRSFLENIKEMENYNDSQAIEKLIRHLEYEGIPTEKLIEFKEKIKTGNISLEIS